MPGKITSKRSQADAREILKAIAQAAGLANYAVNGIQQLQDKLQGSRDEATQAAIEQLGVLSDEVGNAGDALDSVDFDAILPGVDREEVLKQVYGGD